LISGGEFMLFDDGRPKDPHAKKKAVLCILLIIFFSLVFAGLQT
jgi:hypothetical protein